jgi:hypothetical protein
VSVFNALVICFCHYAGLNLSSSLGNTGAINTNNIKANQETKKAANSHNIFSFLATRSDLTIIAIGVNQKTIKNIRGVHAIAIVDNSIFPPI